MMQTATQLVVHSNMYLEQVNPVLHVKCTLFACCVLQLTV
jgi:hypothetical protein